MNIVNKSFFLNQNSTFELIESKISKLKKDQVTLKVLRSSICSSDINRVYNKGAYYYPIVLGHEYCGEIINISKSTQNKNKFQIGDKVAIYPLIPCFKCKNCSIQNFNYCLNYNYYGSRQNGGFCKYINIYDWNLFKINNLNIDYACLIEPISVGIESIKKIKLNKKNKILIVGAGFIGSILVKLIYQKTGKKNLYVIDRNIEKLNNLIKYANINLVDLKKINSNYLGKKKFSYIIDASGSTGTLGIFIEFLDYYGNLILINNHYGNNSLNKHQTSLIMRKNLTITGSWNSEFNNKKLVWKQSVKFIKSNISFLKNICYGPVEIKNISKLFNYLKNKKIDNMPFKKTKIIMNNEYI